MLLLGTYTHIFEQELEITRGSVGVKATEDRVVRGKSNRQSSSHAQMNSSEEVAKWAPMSITGAVGMDSSDLEPPTGSAGDWNAEQQAAFEKALRAVDRYLLAHVRVSMLELEKARAREREIGCNFGLPTLSIFVAHTMFCKNYLTGLQLFGFW